MTITQFFAVLKVGFLFSYLSPLVIVVGVSMLKELIDDIHRRKQDKLLNNEEYKVHKKPTRVLTASFVEYVKSKDLKIGDVVELTENQRVPADMVVLKTFNDAGDNHAFIRTDQLDGETDWKLRKAPALLQQLTELELLNLQGHIQYKPPSKMLYNFEGVLEYRDNAGELKKEALGLENTI